MSNPNTFRNVVAAGALMGVAGGLAGCDIPSSPTPDQATPTASAPHHEAHTAPLSLPQQYDDGYNYVTGLGDNQPGPLDIPKTITDPNIRTLTLRAADLSLASTLIDEANSYNPGDATKGLQFIQEPAVRNQAVEGIGKQLLQKEIDDVGNDTTEPDVDRALADDLQKNDPAAYQADMQTIAKARDAQTSINQVDAAGNYANSYYAARNTYNAISGQVGNDQATSSSDLTNDYSAAVAAIAQGPQGERSQQEVAALDAEADKGSEDIAGCKDKIDQGEQQTCISGWVQVDIDSNDPASFKKDDALLTDPTLQSQAQAAAAGQAVSAAQEFEAGDFQQWYGTLTDPEQQRKAASAATDRAISEVTSSPFYEAALWEKCIPPQDAKDLIRLSNALYQDAQGDYAEGLSSLGDVLIAELPVIPLNLNAHLHEN